MFIQFIRISILTVFTMGVGACSAPESIFDQLKSEEDGSIAVAIPDDREESLPREPSPQIDSLSEKEVELIDQWHEGDYDQLSFVVVEEKSNQIFKSYKANLPQRLASISKLATALAALENVRNVEVLKVAKMLKNSHNGEASRYVRLSAKALDGLELSTSHYPQAHSCPDEFLNDEPAADVVFNWLTSELAHVDWSGSDYNDGAGCHYDNFMSALQVAKILEYAALKGAAYDSKEFEELLSINGKDGTWKNKNLDDKGYIFAKTGTLNPNSNLAGYFYVKRNNQFKRFYFSIFVNKKGPGQYSTKARKLIEGLMRYWIDYYSVNDGVSLGAF